MQSRTLILTSLLLPALASAQALPPDDFFHSGAQWYLSNKVAEARSQVDAGLKLYPDDIKLKKLDELLKQQQQQQQQQQQEQDQKEQQQDQKNQDQKNQDQQKQQSGQDEKDKEQAQRDQQQKEKERQEKAKQEQERQKQKAEQQKQQQEQQKQQGEQDKQSGEPQEGEDAAQVQGMLTPQQARQILDAQKTDEKMLPVDIQKQPEKPGAPRRIKDW
jgi:Ca-activated chloride channel family protein